MSEGRGIRAKQIAASVSKLAAASVKPRAGTPTDTVRFGMAQNLGAPAVMIPFSEFDQMGDDAVMARLREAWGV